MKVGRDGEIKCVAMNKIVRERKSAKAVFGFEDLGSVSTSEQW